MGIKAVLASTANRVLKPLGVMLVRRQATMVACLERILIHQIELNTIIDIGASNGKWSLQMKQYFPAANFVLFEPLAERAAELAVLAQKHANFHPVAAACGSTQGSVLFEVASDLDGSGIATTGSGNTREVPVTTVDCELAKRSLPGPYLLKLDTHGVEVAILEGAGKTLEQTRILIIESYNFQLRPECLRFHELCAYMERCGFRCYDLADPLMRARDGVFWQMDLFFARKDESFFTYQDYA